MIQLDENHWVASAAEVRAIRPMFIVAYDSDGRVKFGVPTIIDPERCMVLIGGDWLQIERGAAVVARALEQTATQTGTDDKNNWPGPTRDIHPELK